MLRTIYSGIIRYKQKSMHAFVAEKGND